MTASGKATIGFQTSEIGSQNWNVLEKFSMSATPTIKYHNTAVQAIADTEEVLSLGGVTTVELLIIHCITNDAVIDLDYTAATFRNGIDIQEGEWFVGKPSGLVYFMNNEAAEKTTFEYWLIGV